MKKTNKKTKKNNEQTNPEEPKNEKLVTFNYQSPFDMFLVQLNIGPLEEMLKHNPGIQVAEGCGAAFTVTCDGLYGALIWMPALVEEPECIATLFHEIVHASKMRFAANKIRMIDTRGEALAYSVSEIGGFFLYMMREWKKDIANEAKEKKFYSNFQAAA